MGRSPWTMSILKKEKETRKGPWTLDEDTKLISYVRQYGAARWNSLAKLAGLKRDGKSCRMRWLNYLRPDLKHGPITPIEEHLIIHLHKRWGNKWSRIADNIPGRTDNEIKNHWKTHIMKMSPQLIGSCNSPPTSKTQGQVMAVREDNEESSSKSFECQEMHSMKECYAQKAHELHTDGYGGFTCEEINQELIVRSSDYAEAIDQNSPICYVSSVADSPITVLSDSEKLSWDYNYVELWNLDHDVHSMHE